MSSIYGRVHLDKRPVTTEDIGTMEAKLDHWAANRKGRYITGAAGLGHLMLYNTPESLHEHLPLHNTVSGCTITADARVDNREEICSLLGIASQDGKNIPDSTLILKLYEKFGSACVRYLLGDFAFAIWDDRKQQLFCARDQMGVKPFFYYHDQNLFAFATEKKGILAIEGVNKEIDKQFFYNQVFWPPQQAADTTLYKNIKRLAPAHTLLADMNTQKIVLHNYWTLDIETEIKLKDERDYIAELRHHFDVAIQCRLRTAYPIGAEFSGGLDSSAIVGAACKYLGDGSLITFSSTHADSMNDEETLKKSERKYIEAGIEFNKIKDYVFVTETPWKDPLERVDLGLEIHDGLEMWNSLMLLPIKYAAKEKHVRTLLSGFPGDEMVTYKGKHFYYDLLHQKKYKQYFLSARSYRAFVDRLLPLVPYQAVYTTHILKNFCRAIGTKLDPQAPFDIPFQYAMKRNIGIWSDNNYKDRFKSYRHYLKAKLLKPQVGLRMETETRYGLHFGLEPRFPLADIRLTQYYLSTPNNLKYGGKINRNMYRSAISDYLPPDILKRNNKTGNMAPFINGPDQVAKKEAHIASIVKKISGKQDLLPVKNQRNIPVSHLDILRWLEKNY